MAQKMDTRERQRKTDDIYENADAIKGKITMEIEDMNTTRIQPSEHTGTEFNNYYFSSWKNNSIGTHLQREIKYVPVLY